MKDDEVRGLILSRLYEVRHQQDFVDVPDGLGLPLDPHTVGNVAWHLDQQGLIQFSQVMGRQYRSGSARILSYGVDVVEGTTKPAISVSFDQSVNIQESSHVQVGHGNIQNVSGVDQINIAIDHADASQNEKAQAKSVLAQLTENKLLMGLLKKFGLSLP